GMVASTPVFLRAMTISPLRTWRGPMRAISARAAPVYLASAKAKRALLPLGCVASYCAMASAGPVGRLVLFGLGGCMLRVTSWRAYRSQERSALSMLRAAWGFIAPR